MASSKGGLVKKLPRRKVALSKGGLIIKLFRQEVVSSKGWSHQKGGLVKRWSRFCHDFFLTEAQETCVGPLDLAPEAVHAV